MQARSLSLIVTLFFITFGLFFAMTGCSPSSGEYGAFSLNGNQDTDKPAQQTPVLTADITGLVTASGTPTPNLGVRVFNEAGTTKVGETLTTADGSFLIQGLPAGTYKVNIGYDSLLFSSATYTVIIRSDGKLFPETVVLKENTATSTGGLPTIAGDLIGTVNSSASGTPVVANIDVRLYRAVGTSVGTFLATTISSTNGQFLFQQLTPGTYQLGLAANSLTFLPATYAVTIKPDGAMFPALLNLPITPRNGAPVASTTRADVIGTIVLSTTNAPLANISLRIIDASSQVQVGSTIVSAPNGQFLFQQIPTGTFRISVAFDSTVYEPATYSITIRSDGTVFPQPLVLQLSPIGAPVRADVIGTVMLNTTNAPLANISLSLIDASSNTLSTTVSTTNGQFLFQQIATGTYRISVAFDSTLYEPATYSITIRSDGTVFPSVLSLLVAPRSGSSGTVTADVRGTVVLNSNGAPADAVGVQIIGTNTYMANVTPPSGEFFFPHVATGTYKAQVALGSALYNPATYTFLVRNDGTVFPQPLTFKVRPAGTATSPFAVDILGHVNEKDNTSETGVKPVKNVLVQLTQNGIELARAITPPAGEFIFTQLNVGTYQIGISRTSYNPATYTVVVQPDEKTLPPETDHLLLIDLSTTAY
ncbi:MAG: carboxypeptidase regulatory-like domain-containing protein [Candidatus Ozemobacteraceae bacterium]